GTYRPWPTSTVTPTFGSAEGRTVTSPPSVTTGSAKHIGNESCSDATAETSSSGSPISVRVSLLRARARAMAGPASTFTAVKAAGIVWWDRVTAAATARWTAGNRCAPAPSSVTVSSRVSTSERLITFLPSARIRAGSTPCSSISAWAGAVTTGGPAAWPVAGAGRTSATGGGAASPEMWAITSPSRQVAPTSTVRRSTPSASAISSSAALEVSRTTTGSPFTTAAPSSASHSTSTYSVSLL